MQKQNFKKTILIDLDGVLNTYQGSFDPDFIPPIKNGAHQLLQELALNYELKIFTTRNRLLTSKWLIKNNLDQLVQDVTNIKEPCWLYIDDRCINFGGNYTDLLKRINNFQVWYKPNPNTQHAVSKN